MMCNKTTKQTLKQTKLPLHIHTRKKTPIPLAKQGFNIHGCPLCNCIITLKDTQKNELTCCDCGYVYDTITYEKEEYTQHDSSKLYSGSSYTHNEKKYMKYKKKHYHKPFMTHYERRQIHYKNIIDSVKYDLNLNNDDVISIQEIINKVKTVRTLHTRIPTETIIIGICRYTLKQRYCLPYLLRFNNKIYKEYKLTRKEYDIIESNIIKKCDKKCIDTKNMYIPHC